MSKCSLVWKDKIVFVLTMMFMLHSGVAVGQKKNRQESDTICTTSRFIHRIGIDVRPEYIIPFNSFLQGNNDKNRSLNSCLSTHLRYSFQYRSGSAIDSIYGHNTYQGIGLAHYSLGDTHELGNPLALYLFQGARLARLTSSLSLNYEWNFGLSFGWKPYDEEANYNNTIIGSRVNAYIFAGLYLNQVLSREFDLVVGYSFTHFSNGNTQIPNAGLNTTGLRLGLVYNMNKGKDKDKKSEKIPLFVKHWNYDLLFFGSWKRTGVDVDGYKYLSPDSYGVFGFNISALYNFGYRFKAGFSLDGLHDGSAGVYAKDNIVPLGHDEPEDPPEFGSASFRKRLALGLSGRTEYVMPFFTIDLGLGANVLAGHSDLRVFYQILALKMNLTNNTFLHIGYSLKNFHTPNHLMLGFGFHFHNKRVSLK